MRDVSGNFNDSPNMKKLSLLLLILTHFSCKEKKNDNDIANDNPPIINPSLKSDTLSWIENFRDFRNSIYTNNREKVKRFIDFPILNYNNEIWYLASGDDEKVISKLSDEIEPFTEKDFDKYFENLFPKRFINAILKIKTEELYKKLDVETTEFREGNSTTYKMYATFDKAKQKLTLNLASKTVHKDEHGEVLDGGEYNVAYIFDILKNGQIKFKQVRLAG